LSEKGEIGKTTGGFLTRAAGAEIPIISDVLKLTGEDTERKALLIQQVVAAAIIVERQNWKSEPNSGRSQELVTFAKTLKATMSAKAIKNQLRLMEQHFELILSDESAFILGGSGFLENKQSIPGLPTDF